MSLNVVKLLHDVMAMPEDEDAVLVKLDSIMPIEGYISEVKAKASFQSIVDHVNKLPPQFLNGAQGWTFLNLPFIADEDGKIGKQWGEQNHAAILCLVCQYYGIFQDPLKTLGFTEDSLKDLPGGVSYVSFNVTPKFIELIRSHLGLK